MVRELQSYRLEIFDMVIPKQTHEGMDLGIVVGGSLRRGSRSSIPLCQGIF